MKRSLPIGKTILWGAYDGAVAVWGWLFGWPRCRRLNNLLVNLGTRGLGIGDSLPGSDGERRALTAWLRRFGRPPVVWDVGAHQGDYTGLVLLARPDARIWAFEPNEATHARLLARWGQAGVHCVACALGRQPGTLELWDYEEAVQGSAHATFYPSAIRRAGTGAALKARPVPVRTIDEVARMEGVEAIDLLKIDVEGHELACLEGAAAMIAAGRIGAVQFEFNLMHLDARVHMGDFSERLPDFTLYRVLPHGLLPLDLKNAMTSNLYRVQNIFAVRRPAGGS